MDCWCFATAARAVFNALALTSQSETKSTSANRKKFSAAQRPAPPQPISPTFGRLFTAAEKIRGLVATAAPATTREETKVRRFIMSDSWLFPECYEESATQSQATANKVTLASTVWRPLHAE